MKEILSALFIFLNAFTCSAQIKNLRSFHYSISFLDGGFKLDQLNKNCKNCYDCREAFTKDSLVRADTTSYKWYTGSRTVGACRALQKLQSLLALDSTLQVKVSLLEQKYKSHDDSLYKNFIQLNKSWYTRLEATVQYFNSFNETTWSGPMIEQIDLATIMVKSRLEELNAIDKLLSREY